MAADAYGNRFRLRNERLEGLETPQAAHDANQFLRADAIVPGVTPRVGSQILDAQVLLETQRLQARAHLAEHVGRAACGNDRSHGPGLPSTHRR